MYVSIGARLGKRTDEILGGIFHFHEIAAERFGAVELEHNNYGADACAALLFLLEFGFRLPFVFSPIVQNLEQLLVQA